MRRAIVGAAPLLMVALVMALVGPTGRAVAATAPPSSPPAGGDAFNAVLLGIGIEAHRGYVRVTEVLHLENDRDRQLTAPVAIPLPRAARFVTFHEGLVQPLVDADRIVDRIPIPPGLHRVVYAYSIAGDGRVDLSRPIAWPIERVDVLALAPAEVISNQLAVGTSATTEGRTYLRASGRLSAPGPFVLSVTGVPSLRRWPARAAAGMLAAILLVGLVYAAARAGVGSTSWKRFQRSR